MTNLYDRLAPDVKEKLSLPHYCDLFQCVNFNISSHYSWMYSKLEPCH